MSEIKGEPTSHGRDRGDSSSNGHVYVFEDFELHTETCELLRAGHPVGLQLKPTRLLLYLIEHRERTVPKDELIEAIWPREYIGETTITTAIGEIRRALSDHGDTQHLIRTFRGRGYRFVGPVAESTPLAFEERDWVLIASFENETGETFFDNTLEHALERALVNSRFVNVVPRERIQDTLRMMKQPLDARIDVSLAREICLRDGAIRALIAGRAEKLGTTYLLSVQIADPAQGVTVDSLSEEAQDEDQIWPAIRRLASGVRETLGEDLSLIRLSESRLAKVITPSLRALQLYSQADALMLRGGELSDFERISGDSETQARAAELLKQSLVEDPEFASAHIHLAWTILNQGGARDEYLEHAERAWELAETTSERERYFIQASYYGMRDEHSKAIACYEALLRVYPDYYWTMGNRLDRFDEGGPYFQRQAELRPNSFEANARAARILVQWGDDGCAQAEPYLRRARALLSPEAEKPSPELAAWMRLFPTYKHWLQGEVEVALSEVTLVGETAKAHSGPEGQVLATYVADMYLTLGKLRDAEEIFRSFPDTVIRHNQLAVVAWVRGDEPAVMEHLLGVGASPFKAMFYLRAGLGKEYRKGYPKNERKLIVRRSIKNPLRVRAIANIHGGERTLAQGQTPEAVRLLEDAVGDLRRTRISYFFWGSETLAQALEQQGEWQRALRVLEEAAQERKAIYETLYLGGSTETPWVFGPPAFFWLRIKWQRAELLRKHGREPEAREIEAELRKLLAFADADHAIGRELRQLSQ